VKNVVYQLPCSKSWLARGAAVGVMFVLMVAATGSIRSCGHLVVLKQNDGGSTFFADTLNNVPGVSFMHQLITPARVMDSKALVQHATAACAKEQIMNGFDARFDVQRDPDDFSHVASNPSVANRMQVDLRGFDPSPTFAGRPDYSALRHLEGVHYLSYTRSNVVHRAVSTYDDIVESHQRKIGQDPPCKSHTLNAAKVSDEDVKTCTQRQFSIDDRRLFLTVLMENACESAAIVDLARALAPASRLSHLMYENFARDQDAELSRLFRWMGLDGTPLNRRAKSSYVKRTSTNMSNVVANIAEVRGWLRQWSGLDAPLEAMLDDVDYTPFGYDQYFRCMHLRTAWRAEVAPSSSGGAPSSTAEISPSLNPTLMGSPWFSLLLIGGGVILGAAACHPSTGCSNRLQHFRDGRRFIYHGVLPRASSHPGIPATELVEHPTKAHE
jgi:hypothetical protein